MEPPRRRLGRARCSQQHGNVRTVSLPGLSDAEGYRLIAKETNDHQPDRTRRRFAVDTTPPVVEIATPAPRAVYAQGQEVEADYRCDEPVCVGPVPDGGFATPGPQSFLVTAADPAGNIVTVRRDHTVDGPALKPAPLVRSAGKPASLLSPDQANRMRPRLGATVPSTQPCCTGTGSRARSSTTSRSSGSPAGAS